MNERINDLFDKALDEVVPNTWTNLTMDQLNDIKNKFAELIVRECVSKIEEAAEYSPELYGVALDLLEHFGVEE